MSQKEPASPDPKAQHAEVVYCARCDHQNPWEFKTCEKCGAHLYVTCHNCGKRNERAAIRCDECGRPLHRSFLKKLRRKFRKGSRYITPGQLLLLLAAVGLAFLLIVLLNGLRFPF